MLDNLYVVGISYRSLPVFLRETFTLKEADRKEAPLKLKHLFKLGGIVCLYTCNRIEYYFEGESAGLAKEIFYQYHEDWLGNSKIDKNIYVYQGSKACEHLFHVTAGLKSLVIGETQIISQLKNAYQISKDLGVLSKMLNLIFQQSFKIAKDVHSQTKISQLKRSVASISVDLVSSIAGDLKDKKALIIGTGETAKLVSLALSCKGLDDVQFATRSANRAKEFASEVKRPVILQSEVIENLSNYDIIFGCANCEEPVIAKNKIKDDSVFQKQKILIDLGVPRNFDSLLGEYENVVLRNIDDLKGQTDQNDLERFEEVEKARQLIKYALQGFLWRNHLSEMYKKAEGQSEELIDQVLKKSSFGDAANKFEIRELLKEVVSKSIQLPFNHLRDSFSKNYEIEIEPSQSLVVS